MLKETRAGTNKRLGSATLTLLLILAACGKAEELRPAAGQALPVRPAVARAAPTADTLLALPVTARPDRIDEPLRRSEERVADPFDLPPPGEPQ